MPIKDQQTRREYFKNYMAKKRKGLTNSNSVKPLADVKPNVKPEPVLLNLECVKPNSAVLNPTENVKPVKPEPVKPQLWSDYSLAKKPWCWGCQRKGIKANDYAFCSEEKIKPTIYRCAVKHWTIYQGQSRKGGKAM